VQAEVEMNDWESVDSSRELGQLISSVRELCQRVRAIEDGIGKPPASSHVSVDVARRLLGDLSRASIYRMIDAGELESVRVRGRRLIAVSSIQQLIETCSGVDEP